MGQVHSNKRHRKWKNTVDFKTAELLPFFIDILLRPLMQLEQLRLQNVRPNVNTIPVQWNDDDKSDATNSSLHCCYSK
jgi:hypothetical protein